MPFSWVLPENVRIRRGRPLLLFIDVVGIRTTKETNFRRAFSIRRTLFQSIVYSYGNDRSLLRTQKCHKMSPKCTRVARLFSVFPQKCVVIYLHSVKLVCQLEKKKK